MKECIYIGWYSKNIHGGGIARNLAFQNYLKSEGFEIINYCPVNIVQRFTNIFKLTLFLFKKKNCTIFIHGNYLITTYLVQLFPINLYVNLIAKLMRRASRNNHLIMEINDLRYEQSLDVKTKKVSDKFVKSEKKILYELEHAYYIFASNNMKNYAIEKYDLLLENTLAIINGGPEHFAFENKSAIIANNKRIKFVYAGTLNKGRQIEDLISIFRSCSMVDLYLLGGDGEWLIHDRLPENIKYLGSFAEKEAHQLVSECDMGLIPYDEEGFYYNLCYPTKASFYITAGIPFLSTRLNELMNIFDQKNVAIFEEITGWGSKISSLDEHQIEMMKDHVHKIQKDYYWMEVLKNASKFIDNKEDR